MRGLHGLADSSTPAYLTVWNHGGGTLVANRHTSDSGSRSTATVPSAYACFTTRGPPLSQGAWPDETLDVMAPADEILQQ
jgi:hypothetical protein